MIKQILIYTRPMEVKFHIELGQTLLKIYPSAELKFITFFYDTHQLLIKNNLHSILFTEELNKITELKDVSHIDMELSQCEGLNLNLLAEMERFLPKDRKAANEFIVKHTMILDKLICENTLSILSMFDHFVYVLAGMLANIRSGFHFSFLNAGMPPNRVIALKTPWETWNYTYTTEYAKEQLNDAISKMDIPAEERIAYMKKTKHVPFYKRSIATINDYINSQKDFNRGNYFLLTPYERFKISVSGRIKRLQSYNDYVDIKTVSELHNIDSPFVYCPLHMEPEATILMYSPWLKNQIELCRLISQALPFGVKLLIKENPKMVYSRQKSFYEKLQELHNVVLVSPKIESGVLINKSIGVISLAGNASLEAAVLGKHNMCFAKPPFRKVLENYNFAENLKLTDLNNILTMWLNNPKYTIDFKNWHNWVNGTFEGNLTPQKISQTDNYEILSTDESLNNCIQYITTVIDNYRE